MDGSKPRSSVKSAHINGLSSKKRQRDHTETNGVSSKRRRQSAELASAEHTADSTISKLREELDVERAARKAAKKARRRAAKAAQESQQTQAGAHSTQPSDVITSTIKDATSGKPLVESTGSQRSIIAKSEPKRSREEESAIFRTTQQDGSSTTASLPSKQLWSLSPRRGGRFIDQDPVFINKKKKEYLITAQGDVVQILSVEGSHIVASLQPRKDREVVSFYAASTHSEDLVRVLYSDGTLVDWDWISGNEDESQLASGSVSLYRLAPLEDRIASVFARQKHNGGAILLDGIELVESREPILDLRVLAGVDIIAALCLNSILLGQRDAAGDYKWIELSLRGDAFCFDVRLLDADKKGKRDIHIAVGFSDGKIHTYSDIVALLNANAPVLPSPRILHWHRDAVGSVKYSPDGSYLISGGKETVLVIWQLDTGNKSYLPNLTAAIERIVVNPIGNRYAVQLGDNSIMVLSTSELKPVAFVSGLQVAATSAPPAALLHPIRKNELLVTVPATQPQLGQPDVPRPFLQSCNPLSGTYSTRQALTRNNVTDFNVSPDKVPIISPDVGLISISSDGRWLATVDEWSPPTRDLAYVADGSDLSPERQEVYLKIWQWHEATAQWRLNSRIDGPHSTDDQVSGTLAGSVLRLVSLPNKSGFVTIGQDAQIKLWSPRLRTRHGEAVLDSAGEQQVEWLGRSLASLDQEAGQASRAALAISDDGSIVTAALINPEDTAHTTIYFIDLPSGTLRTGNNNIADPDLLELAFADRYLIALSLTSIRIWDVVEDILQWSALIMVDNGFEADRLPLLAVNKLDNALIVASPAAAGMISELTICQLQPPLLKDRIPTTQRVTTILPRPNERGCLLVYDDATTGTLSTTASAALRSVAAPIDSIEAPVETPREPLLLESAVRKLEATGYVEDDRRVVRQEEMAKIFDDGPNGAALPSIKDMFHAVAGLFGRRPRDFPNV